jgi:stage II sporulation protein D
MGRRIGLWAALAAVFFVLRPLACTRQHAPTPPQTGTPVVRVRLLVSQDSVTLRANTPPTVKTATERSPLRLNIAAGVQTTLVLTNDGWVIGGVLVPGGRSELTLTPVEDASVSINDKPYRGTYRFVPAGITSFDVINDVDVDSYLKGVLACELYKSWNEEAYRAQAIVARTYALYEARTRGVGKNWDVYPDQRSQVYGGYSEETAKSRAAADDTAGIVLAFGPAGEERIFKTYFSACCGGITQSAADAFGDHYLVPLSDQDVRGLCNASKTFNWGPVELTRTELTRRLRAYGARRKSGERDMANVARLEIQSANRFNRPIRFVVIDETGTRYSLSGEELRVAVNSGTTKEAPAKLLSSFVKVINDPGSDVIRFVEGHGNGHGVGMCQYCTEARAEAGMRHEDIVLCAFPRAKLVRAY